jgi:hypothetical protein
MELIRSHGDWSDREINRLKSEMISMNKFLRGFLHLLTMYFKIEIVGGLILVILVLGYVVFALNRSDRIPSVPDTAPKEKLDKIGQPSLVLGLELLIFRSWQAKRATY